MDPSKSRKKITLRPYANLVLSSLMDAFLHHPWAATWWDQISIDQLVPVYIPVALLTM